MNECMLKFTDFCPSDRGYFILTVLLIFFFGWIVGREMAKRKFAKHKQGEQQ